MSTQKSIRLSDDSVEVIKSICKDNVNFNGAINSIIERYSLIVSSSLPELTKHEELAIAQSYNGYWYDFNQPIEEELKRLHWQIDQAIQYDGNVLELLSYDYDYKYKSLEEFRKSEELKDFISKVKSWSFAERMAVFHGAISFWAKAKPDMPEEE